MNALFTLLFKKILLTRKHPLPLKVVSHVSSPPLHLSGVHSSQAFRTGACESDCDFIKYITPGNLVMIFEIGALVKLSVGQFLKIKRMTTAGDPAKGHEGCRFPFSHVFMCSSLIICVGR